MGRKKYHTEEERKAALNKNYIKYRKTATYRRCYLNGHLKRKYGITLEAYEALLKMQDGKCKICAATRSVRVWRDGRIQRVLLFVDHDHSTGVVRGLLCNKCNVGLAMFDESAEFLVSAIAYLKEN